MRILIVFAHPAYQKSRINKQLITAVRDIDGVELNDLYESYPDFHIQIKQEQEKLVAADCVVFQFPLYWFSCPALLKEWFDLVLEHGFAYGNGGNALRGKFCLYAVSTGGRQSAYQRGGHNHYTIPELLTPLLQAAHMCGMKTLPPFVTYGTHMLTAETMQPKTQAYRSILTALHTDRYVLEHLDLNESLDTQLDIFMAKDD